MTTIAQEGKKVNVMKYRRPSYSVGEHARKFDKVYIVGMASSASMLPNDAHENAETWKLNEAYRLDEYYGRVVTATRWFQFHQRWDFTRRQNVNRKGEDHWSWLRKQHPFPIYMQEQFPDIPSSVAFPLGDITRDLLGDSVPFHFSFFRNSLAYQVAFAIWLGFKKVGIYGWELASDTEMKYERPSATFWLGWLAALIGPENIEIPMGGRLLAGGARRYAFDDVPAVNRMHIESSLNNVRGLEYDAQVNLRRDPNDQEAKLASVFFAGQRTSYERLMAELDDVSDPRGSFHEKTEDRGIHEETTATAEDNAALDADELRSGDLQD